MGTKIQEMIAQIAAGAAPVKEATHYLAGISTTMVTLQGLVAEIAPTNIPILLVGEIGTGKEAFAQYVHQQSERCQEPFVKIACASRKEDSFAADLGLNRNWNVESAQGSVGTLLFDEISELNAGCQRNLLYALPNGDEEPNPDTKQLTARVISTTNKNLDEETQAGRFRSELFYRINGVCLRLPPLRERREDISLLAEYFLAKHAARFGRARISLSAQTLQTFEDHSWPGNVRELENVVKKIVALGDDRRALSEFSVVPAGSRAMAASATGGAVSHSLKAAARAASRSAEREMILKALARTRWNRKRAAQELQISYKSLLYKLKQIGLPESGLAE
jgi:two-component system, NtrC family, response regulator AtoC